MSILIKGMDMPKVCGQCCIAKAISCDGWKYVRSIQLDRWKYCPLVEVVHCKDCKYLHRTVCPYGISKTPHGNDYCSYGDRKDDKD